MMSTYDTRIDKIRRRMAEAGLDLLLIYSDGRHSFLDCEPVLYASGFKPMGPQCTVLIPKDGDALLIVFPSWDRGRAERFSKVRRVIGSDDVAADFARLVREGRLAASKVGIIGHARLSLYWRDLIGSQFAVPPVPFDREFDEIAKVRDALELNLQSQAACFADKGFEHMLKVAEPGMREYELAAEVDRHMKSLGAEDNFQLMSASQHNLAVRPPGDRRLDVGDIILGEISPSVDGQFVQICRTAVVGTATKLQREKHGMLVDAMLAAMEAGRAGAKASDLARAIDTVVTRAGYGEYCRPPYMRVRGHGFGMGSMMPGAISEDNDTVLEAGMTFVLHPNQYIPETGYLLVGEPVLVTDGGLRTLTSRPLGLAEIEL
jgi:Xaa-Pro dipeptidase